MKRLSITRRQVVSSVIYAMRFLNWCITPIIFALAGLALALWHEVAHLKEPILVSAADAQAISSLFCTMVVIFGGLQVLITSAPKWPRPRTEHDEPR